MCSGSHHHNTDCLRVEKKHLKLIDNCSESNIVGKFTTTSWDETVSEPVIQINRYSKSGENYANKDMIKIDCFKTKDITKESIPQHLMMNKKRQVDLRKGFEKQSEDSFGDR